MIILQLANQSINISRVFVCNVPGIRLNICGYEAMLCCFIFALYFCRHEMLLQAMFQDLSLINSVSE